MNVNPCKYLTVALLTTSSSPEIDISQWRSGEVVVPNGETLVTLSYFIAAPAGTYYTARDSAAAAIVQTVAANSSYPIPSALFGAGLIQIRSNVAGNVGIILKE